MNDVMLRRCCIACDVLYKLDEGTIRAKHGCYVDPDPTDAPGCNVCAVGSLIVGVTQDVGILYGPESTEKILYTLAPYWNMGEAREIEAAFEGCTFLGAYMVQGDTDREQVARSMFGYKHEIPEYRIRSIMANILKNDGEFDVSTKVDPDGTPIEKCVVCHTLVKS